MSEAAVAGTVLGAVATSQDRRHRRVRVVVAGARTVAQLGHRVLHVEVLLVRIRPEIAGVASRAVGSIGCERPGRRVAVRRVTGRAQRRSAMVARVLRRDVGMPHGRPGGSRVAAVTLQCRQPVTPRLAGRRGAVVALRTGSRCHTLGGRKLPAAMQWSSGTRRSSASSGCGSASCRSRVRRRGTARRCPGPRPYGRTRAGSQAVVTWQESQSSVVGMWSGVLPVAVVPLWQVAQLPEHLRVVDAQAGTQAVVAWQTRRQLVVLMWCRRLAGRRRAVVAGGAGADDAGVVERVAGVQAGRAVAGVAARLVVDVARRLAGGRRCRCGRSSSCRATSGVVDPRRRHPGASSAWQDSQVLVVLMWVGVLAGGRRAVVAGEAVADRRRCG